MKRDVVLLGASWGGVHTIARALSDLPEDFGACVIAVQHLARASELSMVPWLQTMTSLRVAAAFDEARLEPGQVYVAPPDEHVYVRSEHIRVMRNPTENGFRPSIDTTFRSAAVTLGSRAIGVILTGSMDDGARGALAIQRCGGAVVVQDPADAVHPEMPQSTLDILNADAVVPVAGLAAVLQELLEQDVGPSPDVPKDILLEARVAEDATSEDPCALGDLVPIGCPECDGALFEVRGKEPPRYICHTGHSFGLKSLMQLQQREVERALYSAFRALQHRQKVLEKLVEGEEQHGRAGSANTFRKRVEETQREIDVIRSLLSVDAHSA